MDQLTLPVATSEPDHAQWRLETLQLVNWGGFHGHHAITLSPDSTLMTGGSGVGKSTLLDSWIALMMPSDVDFNGASNDIGAGRVRAPEKRNLISYLRGKQDKQSDGSGHTRELVLRGGDGGPVWGALACTFSNDNGRKYTVMRAFFVKAGATVASDVTTTFAAADGYVDLARLELLVTTRFDKRAMKNALPGLDTFNSFKEFEANLHTRLHIGRGEGGPKAIRLLSRVQAGMQINRVDDLYKTMVLERPVTYKVADDALAHFADLKASYLKMIDEAEKVKVLRRLPTLQDELAAAQDHADLISQFGADRVGPTPFQLWRLQTERALLDSAVDANRRDHVETTAAFVGAKTAETEHEQQLEQIAEEKRANGGGAIDERQRETARLKESRDRVHRANLRFQARTEPINLIEPETADQFADAHIGALEFLSDYEDRLAALVAEEQAAQDDLSPLTTRQRDLLAEKKSLHGRSGMVPRRLHEARVRMAEAAGLDPMSDLPFVAELMDVLPTEEHWRKAIETTLGGVARIVLVDRRVRDHFSAAIDGVAIRPRIQFQAVTLAPHEDWRGDCDYVSGKLTFKDSPFSGWVQERVSERGVDHLCVPNPKTLSASEPCVTPSGQTRHGDKGAHGESGDGPIIGFSNERRLADIDTLLTELRPEMKAAQARIGEVRDRQSDLRRQREAYVVVQDTEWAAIDYLGIDRRVAELEAEIQRLRGSNKILDALQAEHDRVKPLLEEARIARLRAQDRLVNLEKEQGRLVDEQDTVQDAVDAIVDAQTATVTGTQQAYLDALFASNWDASDLRSFDSNIRAMVRRLSDEVGNARKIVAGTRQSMEGMFEAYKSRWTENNLGISVESADGYREILDRIQSEGLHERRDKWRRELAAWSSDDLLRLSDAFETALEDIEERLRPVNRILESLPFGGKGFLQIDLRRNPSENVRRFRRSLRELSSGLALELSEHQIENRFKRLSEFMAQISIPEGHTKSSTADRDRYLDVRQHVVITAQCVDEHGREIATYDYIGGKSGGEMQELVAFIVGSALRYQLGDETRSRPRFAPVFLDEAFIKADSEFAGRAVRAWQNLGFQLIVGAPFDKVTSLEPYMDLLLTATKNERGYSYIIDLPNAPDDTGDAA
ncbi:MAG TPA: SbcC/MukB-like Walker B domain-containing protein [Propionibacteriaceae bacterium]|nr:SbcC/MukB-like Walker B domain-containing protein [Propionibacteriaceae bacterium]